jgi:hypothetical protein
LAERLSEHYSVRRADLLTDRHHILRLWRLITGGTAPDGHKLDWFYLENPAGPGTIYLLWHDPTNIAVGVTCAGRRDLLIGQTVVKGAVCGDLVIDPAHRGRGPARRFRIGGCDSIPRPTFRCLRWPTNAHIVFVPA